jgi:hypothetical protein
LARTGPVHEDGALLVVAVTCDPAERFAKLL